MSPREAKPRPDLAAVLPCSDYFEHEADIGVVGRGASLEQAFVAAAVATFAIMVEADTVRPLVEVEVAFEEEDPELALVCWLNALLAAARRQGLALGRFELTRAGRRWHGRAAGEPWCDAHRRGTEVKGATLTALAVVHQAGHWVAQCVVDV
jgi:SHS2 domain-containing protein